METLATVIAHDKIPAAVKAVSAAIPRKTPKPILRNIRARATDRGGVEIYATDLETSLVVSLGDMDGETVATTLVPVDMAAAIGKAKGTVSIVPGGGVVESLGARSPAEDAMEYPRPPEVFDCGFAAWVPFGFVRAADEGVACATDLESSRYALGGILLERRGATVHAVGTDGRRLHVVSVDDGGADKADFAAIVYPRAVRLFCTAVQAMAAGIVGKGGRAAAAYCGGASVGIRVRGDDVELSWVAADCHVRMVTRAVQGRFPRWRDCIPVVPFDPSPIIVPMPAGREQIVTASRFQDAMSRGVQFNGTGKTATLSAQSSERGEYSAPFVGRVPEGVKIKLDPAYLLDMIDAAVAVGGRDAVPLYAHPHDQKSGVTVKVNGGIDPIDGVGFAAIVMPLAAD